MHPALQLTEIFEIVCSFSDRRMLARLARTCRTFEDPSLNALWYALYVAENTLSRLSGVILGQPEAYGNTMARQLPTYDRWVRMRRYTSRIAVVFFTTYGYQRSQVILGRLRYIASLSQPEALSPMFPKLKEIFISGLPACDDNISLLRYVNGPSVTHIWWTVNSDQWGRISDFSTSLVSLYPNARSVQIVTSDVEGTPTEKILQNLSQAIRNWGHLISGSFTVLDALAYEHLCRLETLASLHIDLSRHGNYVRLQEAELPPVPFPTLKNIHLNTCTMEDLIHWINRHNLFPLVSNVSCEMQKMSSQSLLEPHDLFNSIAARFRPQSLQSIHLFFRHWHFHWEIIVHLNSLRPLFSFNHLRSMNLSRFCTLSMDDSELETLASSCPLLEELVLNHLIPEKHMSLVGIPTFRGLFKLVEHCPCLRVLAIVIDARDTAWVDLESPCDGACTRMVSGLVLGNSLIDDAKRVASILREIFPFLEEVKKNTPIYQRTMSSLLDEVNFHLANLSIAANNERHTNRTKRRNAQSHESY